jgi:hypothetical protein
VGILTETDILRAYVEQEKVEPGPLGDVVVEDRPGAFEAATTGMGAAPAIVVSGTAVRQGERRPVLLIRVPGQAVADLRQRLTAAGHPPING